MRQIKRGIMTVALCLLVNMIYIPDLYGSKKFDYRGFSGGMMLHTGYVSSREFTITGSSPQSVKAEGMPTGIGGAIRFSFGDHLRLGTEGYVSNLTYGDYDNSRISLGWGGLLADVIFEGKKISPYLGVTLGGGRLRNITISAPTPLDFIPEKEVSFRSYSMFVVTPYVGAEYSVTSKLKISVKLDYIFNLSASQPDFIHGPRIYIGFIFDRTK